MCALIVLLCDALLCERRDYIEVDNVAGNLDIVFAFGANQTNNSGELGDLVDLIVVVLAAEASIEIKSIDKRVKVVVLF